MSKLDWAKANRVKSVKSLSDEREFLARDRAAKWLERVDLTARKAINKQSIRRIDRRQGPADQTGGLKIYTDGACVPNPGEGGWGFVVYECGTEIYATCGGERRSTNNIMELMAVLRAIRWMQCEGLQFANIFSDSQYVVNGCNKWRFGWKRRGWVTADKKPVKNADLWQEIDQRLGEVQVSISWVKGHAGILGNERADQLSNDGRRYGYA